MRRKITSNNLIVKFWADSQNRRDVFIDFAKTRGKDPLQPDTWYSFKLKDIEESKVLLLLLSRSHSRFFYLLFSTLDVYMY